MIKGRFTRAHHTSVVDQYVDAATFFEHLIDDVFPTLFIGDVQDGLSETQLASGLRLGVPDKPFRSPHEKNRPSLHTFEQSRKP